MNSTSKSNFFSPPTFDLFNVLFIFQFYFNFSFSPKSPTDEDNKRIFGWSFGLYSTEYTNYDELLN